MGSPQSVDPNKPIIGVVAGNGHFPAEFISNAVASGHRVVVAAHRDETEPEVEGAGHALKWIKVGQFQKIVRFFESQQVEQVAFIGGIKRSKLFRSMWPDRRALKVIARVGSIRDDAILRGAIEEFERAGFEVIPSDRFLPDSCPAAGTLSSRTLNEGERMDAELGWSAAKRLGELDAGQTVIVHSGVIVALEGVEGTDRAIQRAGELSGKGGIVVKVPKPQQDLRVDMPAIGPKTIDSICLAGCTGLVVEAEKTLLLDPELVRRMCNENSIAFEVWSGESCLTEQPRKQRVS